jgi:uncharacterized protein (TIGR00106 family)
VWSLRAQGVAVVATGTTTGAGADCGVLGDRIVWRTIMLVAFSVTPLGVGEGVAEYVADAVRVVRDSGLPNRTDAMFTTVEGDWDEVMAVVKQAVDTVAAKAPRVSMVLKADIRPGVTGALAAKVESVERHLAT